MIHFMTGFVIIANAGVNIIALIVTIMINVIGSDYIQHQTFSYALRFNYSYKGRYMLTVSNRWDGDSRLSKGNKDVYKRQGFLHASFK